MKNNHEAIWLKDDGFIDGSKKGRPVWVDLLMCKTHLI